MIPAAKFFFKATGYAYLQFSPTQIQGKKILIYKITIFLLGNFNTIYITLLYNKLICNLQKNAPRNIKHVQKNNSIYHRNVHVFAVKMRITIMCKEITNNYSLGS